jgi:hypothetical protein
MHEVLMIPESELEPVAFRRFASETSADLRARLEAQDETPFWRSTATGVVRNSSRLLELVTGYEPSYGVAARTAHLVARSRRVFDGLLAAAGASASTMAEEVEVARIEAWGSEHYFELPEELRDSISGVLELLEAREGVPVSEVSAWA